MTSTKITVKKVNNGWIAMTEDSASKTFVHENPESVGRETMTAVLQIIAEMHTGDSAVLNISLER
jgi:hypothetical protein